MSVGIYNMCTFNLTQINWSAVYIRLHKVDIIYFWVLNSNYYIVIEIKVK